KLTRRLAVPPLLLLIWAENCPAAAMSPPRTTLPPTDTSRVTSQPLSSPSNPSKIGTLPGMLVAVGNGVLVGVAGNGVAVAVSVNVGVAGTGVFVGASVA